VEQKNYATVRKVVGYFRYEEEQGVSALHAVYDAYNPLPEARLKTKRGF
jgi:hypothetical protein